MKILFQYLLPFHLNATRGSVSTVALASLLISIWLHACMIWEILGGCETPILDMQEMYTSVCFYVQSYIAEMERKDR